ncbi:MAG: 50S ribosomal protein L24 [Planctomycetaceae bacterium]|nr:50S ribosomal protein L24 [Planctomycetaceae bacterium]
MRIKSNDTVKVISGEDRGATGKVLRVNRKTGKLVVEGVNRVYKHVKRSQKNPQGGRLSKEMPIQASNVLLICEKCGAASRLGVRFLPNGAKERYCKKCGAGNGQVSPPKARYAQK